MACHVKEVSGDLRQQVRHRYRYWRRSRRDGGNTHSASVRNQLRRMKSNIGSATRHALQTRWVVAGERRKGSHQGFLLYFELSYFLLCCSQSVQSHLLVNLGATDHVGRRTRIVTASTYWAPVAVGGVAANHQASPDLILTALRYSRLTRCLVSCLAAQTRQ